MSFCTRPTVAAKKAVVAPKTVTTPSAIGASSNSGDSRATMNTPAVTMVAAWIRAETGVGPSMASGSQVCSRNCADLPMAPMNSRRQISGQHVDLHPQKFHGLADLVRGRGEHRVVLQGVEHGEDGEDAEREAEIADAVDDEGLDGGGIGRGPVVPEADEEVAHQADALPAEEELKEVVRRHQRQHGEGEEREIGEEARAVRVLLHVADGVEVHEARDRGHHHQHHGGKRVDAKRPGGLQRAGIDEAQQLDARLMPLDADLIEGEPGKQRGDQHEARGDDFACARGHEPAEEAGEDGADQREKDDRLIHRLER